MSSDRDLTAKTLSLYEQGVFEPNFFNQAILSFKDIYALLFKF